MVTLQLRGTFHSTIWQKAVTQFNQLPPPSFWCPHLSMLQIVLDMLCYFGSICRSAVLPAIHIPQCSKQYLTCCVVLGPSSDICQRGPIHLRTRRHQAIDSVGAVWWGAQESRRQAQSEGRPQHPGVRRPRDGKVTVPQVRGEDGAAGGVHDGSGSVGCGSDGLRPEKPHLQGVDTGGRCSGSGRQRRVSHWRVWQGAYSQGLSWVFSQGAW